MDHPNPFPDRLIAPSAQALADCWLFHGTLVLEPGGVSFFVADSQFHPSGMDRLTAWAAGVLGSIAAGALADRLLESSAPKPSGLRLGPRDEQRELYSACLADAPGLLSCKEQFRLPLKEIRGAWAFEDDLLFVAVDGFTLEVSGVRGAQEMCAALRRWGCPGRPAWVDAPSPWRRFLGVVLLVGTGAAVMADLLEAQNLFNWMVSAFWDGVLGFNELGAGSRALFLAAVCGVLFLAGAMFTSRREKGEELSVGPEAPLPDAGPFFPLLVTALSAAWAMAAFLPISLEPEGVEAGAAVEPGSVLITYIGGKKCLMGSAALDYVNEKSDWYEGLHTGRPPSPEIGDPSVLGERVLKTAELEDLPLARFSEIRFACDFKPDEARSACAGAELVLGSGLSLPVAASEAGLLPARSRAHNKLLLKGRPPERGCPAELELSAKTFARDETPLRAEFR